jgi:glycosyltransferase involved in cell wall biosynthesis/predicted O-methyltransferase YrrM
MSNNIRILICNDDSDISGVAVYTHSLACGLARLGYEITCLQTENDSPMIGEQRQFGVQHCWLPFSTRGDFWRTMTKETDAAEAFAAVKPDVVVFADCDPFSHIAAKKAAEAGGYPFVIVENYVWSHPKLPRKIAQFLPDVATSFERAKAVVAVSRNNLDLLHHKFGLPPDKGQVIHYGRPDRFFAPPKPGVRARLREEARIPMDAIVCMTVARLEKVKGHELILDALRLMRSMPSRSVGLSADKLFFAWIGTGSLRASLEEALQENGLAKQVKLLGQRWDVVDWLDASDLFILPSLCEGMPLSIMEAMARGLPVMASAVSGVPEELGDTGKLLPSPLEDSDATVREIVATLEQWASDAHLRKSIGAACQSRASSMFREERMIDETRHVIDRAALPDGDYVSPEFLVVRPDRCFPNMVVGDRERCTWAYLRRDIPHNVYVDKRAPDTPFINRDEALILYNTALGFRSKRCLEIGGWLGWSSCHLALGGVLLDVIDPMLANPAFQQSVQAALQMAGVLDRVNLVNGSSPQHVEAMGWQLGRKWSLFFIDGDHTGAGPVNDASICMQFAEPDAMILFHDLVSPGVARGLEYLRYRGWDTMIYSTMQIMGVAWRGSVQPVLHRPDPRLPFPLPPHLGNCQVSNG